jgi:hypothetical protein
MRSSSCSTAACASTPTSSRAGGRTPTTFFLGSPTACNFTSANNDTAATAPGYLDAAAHDYRLRHDSPVIDTAGSTTPTGDESPEDRIGKPRIVDGDNNGTADRDNGAFEYQRQAPQAGATATPSSPSTGHRSPSTPRRPPTRRRRPDLLDV